MRLDRSFTIEKRLPTAAEVGSTRTEDPGPLLTYAAQGDELWSRAAWYVDRVLKGAKPGDLPIQQPTTFDLVVNLKTATAIGLTVPQSILLRAAKVIESRTGATRPVGIGRAKLHRTA